MLQKHLVKAAPILCIGGQISGGAAVESVLTAVLAIVFCQQRSSARFNGKVSARLGPCGSSENI